MRRTSDRIESALTTVLVTAFLILGTIVGVTAGNWAYDTSEQAERVAGPRHEVKATLLADAHPLSAGQYDAVTPQPVRARWVYNGSDHVGRIHPGPGADKGDRIDVWVDGRGQVAAPPREHSQVVGQAWAVGLSAVAGVGLALFGVRAFVRRALERRRMDSWEAEWADVEPAWNPYR